MDYKAMIERRLKPWGYSVQEWNEDDESRPVAVLGKAQPLDEDDDRGLWPGEEYELSAHAVGSEKYGNLRVCLILTEEGMDRFSGTEVSPGEVELV